MLNANYAHQSLLPSIVIIVHLRQLVVLVTSGLCFIKIGVLTQLHLVILMNLAMLSLVV